MAAPFLPGDSAPAPVVVASDPVPVPVPAPSIIKSRPEVPMTILALATLVAIVVLQLSGATVPTVLYDAFFGLVVGVAGVTIPRSSD